MSLLDSSFSDSPVLRRLTSMNLMEVNLHEYASPYSPEGKVERGGSGKLAGCTVGGLTIDGRVLSGDNQIGRVNNINNSLEIGGSSLQVRSPSHAF